MLNEKQYHQVGEVHWRNLKELIEDKAHKNGNKSFLLYEDRVLSYRDVHEISNALANGLRELGVKKGDNVITYMFNSPEYILTWFALAKVGAIMVSVNTAAKGDELKHYLTDSMGRTIILDSSLLKSYLEVKGKVNIETEIVLKDGAPTIPKNMIDFSDIRIAPTEDLKTDLKKSDPVTIIYTSGTTGKPKGVLLPHFYYINSGLFFAKIARFKPGDRFFAPLPIYHLGGQLSICISSMIADNDFVLVKRFSASKFWKQVKRYNCTGVHFIGSIPQILFLQPEKPDDIENPVERFFGAGMTKDLWEKFEKRFGVTVLECYGLTEFGGASSGPLSNKVKVGSVGLPRMDQRIEIMDENDEILPPYSHGEIVIRPEAPYTMMLGYYNNSDATWSKCSNLWFHTGDIGYKDEEGYLYFVGRQAHFLRRRGENISAEEVEMVIDQHPQVNESAVVGVPSELGEEEVKAYIIPKTAGSIAPEEIIRWCEERISYFKVPRYIEFLVEIPKTPTNRIERYKLKERGIGHAWDREKAGYRLKKG